MMKSKIKAVFAAGLLALFLTGCSSHVLTTEAPQGTSLMSQAGVSFLVPDAVYSGAVDYHTLTDVVYKDQKAIDSARVELSNTTVYGTQGEDFLLTSNKKCFFYVTPLPNMAVPDITTLTRDDLVNNLGITNFNVQSYGRMIANADATPKAIIRANFSSIGFNGAEYNYAGYIGFAEVGGIWYTYIAGYADATPEDIAMTRTLVKSLR